MFVVYAPHALERIGSEVKIEEFVVLSVVRSFVGLVLPRKASVGRVGTVACPGGWDPRRTVTVRFQRVRPGVVYCPCLGVSRVWEGFALGGCVVGGTCSTRWRDGVSASYV